MRSIDRYQGEAAVEFFQTLLVGDLNQGVEARIRPVAITLELPDESGGIGRVGGSERFHQARRPQSAVALDAGPGEQSEQDQRGQRPATMEPPGFGHHSRVAALTSSSSVVSSLMFAHSSSDGRRRFSGFAFQSEDRSTSRSSALPRRVSRCFRVSQSRKE